MELAFFMACGLLLVGFVLRSTVKAIQTLFIPASVIGGLLGLTAVTVLTPFLFTISSDLQTELVKPFVSEPLRNAFASCGVALSSHSVVFADEMGRGWHLKDQGNAYLLINERSVLNVYRVNMGFNGREVVNELRTWPGWLIAVIFAGLLIERPGKSLRKSLRLAAREGIVVWIIVLGEIMIGLLATWLVIRQFRSYQHVPGSFGQLIEAGFAGGHGTAAALGDVFVSILGFPEGRDLGFVFATVGLIFGVVSGIVYINIAVRRGWTRAGDVDIPRISGLEAATDPQPIAYGRVRSEVIDPLVFQGLILAVAVMLGMGIKWAFIHMLPSGSVMQYANNLPLFLFTLIAGLLVREGMHLFKIGNLIDPDAMCRLTGAAIEFLIVAAVASLNLSVILEFGWPTIFLMILGFLWTGFCLFFVARRLLPRAYWFELGILNYGMSTGTTAQGMMLLRIIDKDLTSGAAEDYALAAPLSAPFIGGGVITLVLLPWLLQVAHIGFIVLGITVLIVLFYVLGTILAARARED